MNLQETLRKHELWIRNEEDGKPADLHGANLRGANLFEADLREADLWRTNLWEADLRGADLRGASLGEANLREADLYKADLCEAGLRGADLREANLRKANLYKADLRGASLYKTKGIKYISFDPRGYILVSYKNGEMFKAGCRDFTYKEALSHWGSSAYEDQVRGKQYIEAIKLLKNLGKEK